MAIICNKPDAQKAFFRLPPARLSDDNDHVDDDDDDGIQVYFDSTLTVLRFAALIV